MDLSLQIQQKQILSQRMQQSVEILQMNTLALSEYIREVAEENPLLDWSEERPLLLEIFLHVILLFIVAFLASLFCNRDKTKEYKQ